MRKKMCLAFSPLFKSINTFKRTGESLQMPIDRLKVSGKCNISCLYERALGHSSESKCQRTAEAAIPRTNYTWGTLVARENIFSVRCLFPLLDLHFTYLRSRASSIHGFHKLLFSRQN